MYYKISDFIQDWKYESESTNKIFSTLTDESLKTAVSNEWRDLGTIAWHITTSIGEMMNRVGINTDSPADNAGIPLQAEEIKTAYQKAASSLSDEVAKNWNDDVLMEEKDMYGEKWKNGITLKILINHQIHHRAQMTVLMRQAGLKVPGVYGPSKEEWSTYGMPPQK